MLTCPPPQSSSHVLFAGNSAYAWGGQPWQGATWAKVHVLAAVYALGFNVIQSDIDVSWFMCGATAFPLQIISIVVCHMTAPLVFKISGVGLNDW